MPRTRTPTVRTGSTGTTPQITTTAPPTIKRHNISDEQLEMLGDLRRDGVFELAWGALGAGLGALPNAIEAILKAYFAETPQALSALGLVNCLLVAAGVGVASVCFVISGSRGAKATSLIQTIRNQPAS